MTFPAECGGLDRTLTHAELDAPVEPRRAAVPRADSLRPGDHAAVLMANRAELFEVCCLQAAAA